MSTQEMNNQIYQKVVNMSPSKNGNSNSQALTSEKRLRSERKQVKHMIEQKRSLKKLKMEVDNLLKG